MLITGKSSTGKTNLLATFVLGDKSEHIHKRQKGGSRYIRCDNLIVCGYHPDEPKWTFVRCMIPNVKSFSLERSIVIIFEDLCVAPEYIQNQIIPFFTHGHHRNISPNLHNTTLSPYTNNYSYLRKGEFIIFDLNKSDDDLLAIRLRFDTPLDLQKEIELRFMASENLLTINNACAIAEKRGELCLSTKYINNCSPLLWCYAKDHKWMARLNDIKNGMIWCPYCAGNRSLTIENARQLAQSRNGTCIILMLSLQCSGDVQAASHTIEDAMQVAFGKNGELYCCIEGTNNVHGILIKCCSRNNGLVGCYDQSICGC
ncbi:hypothetical protein GLOIN_2v1871466 [Rhizophagus clarus]|uniref:Uncharacterized protein n=1 Tax=Rhizophagus clarus TaxID=94130 RepID=A0A8H3LIT1_9GLOM|nr:hypothetical protein GLOIN_2v1871466 [Rhizophagus clarus]